MSEHYELRSPVPAFDAVLPAPVRYNDALSAGAKLLYCEIRALSSRYGFCVAGNAYFAALYQVTERTVARQIKQLEELQFINVVSTRDAAGHVDGRRIYVSCSFPASTAARNPVMGDNAPKLPALADKGARQVGRESSASSACAGKCEGSRLKRKRSDAEPRAELVRWARETFPGNSDELVDALMRYCDMRCEEGWTMERVSTATRCEKRLMSFSKGNIPMIIAILEQSISIPWQDVYALKKDDPFWEGRSAPSRNGADEEWI